MRPNILWICTDQQRYDTIGALGYSHVSTPNIDRLVKGGVAFTHAYCQSTICTPSRSSFLTGVYASTLGNNRNGNRRFSNRRPLVTKLLADAGYDCGLIGKLHLAGAFGRVEPRFDDGYRFWQYSHAPRPDWDQGHDYADWVREKGEVLGELTNQLEGVPAEFHQTTWCAEKTIEFMKEERTGPWLASVNIYDPHPPFNPPKAYRNLFDPEKMPGPLFRDSDLVEQKRLEGIDFQSKARNPNDLDLRDPLIPKTAALTIHAGSGRAPSAEVPAASTPDRDAKTLQAAYYSMIKLIDDQVGCMFKVLEETGQLERTVIIFTSDHGETLGDHGLIQKGCRFYEGLVRVPLIFFWPGGGLLEGVVSDALVELMDVMPTVLELSGEPVPDHVMGRSLLPILRGVADPSHHRKTVRCEYLDAADLPDGTRATMLRDRQYKLVIYHGHGLGELYDLANDPGEFVNLWDAPEYLEVKSRLMHQSFDKAMEALDLGVERIGPM